MNTGYSIASKWEEQYGLDPSKSLSLMGGQRLSAHEVVHLQNSLASGLHAQIPKLVEQHKNNPKELKNVSLKPNETIGGTGADMGGGNTMVTGSIASKWEKYGLDYEKTSKLLSFETLSLEELSRIQDSVGAALKRELRKYA